MFLSPIKLCNFIHGFLNGTETKPRENLFNEEEDRSENDYNGGTQQMLEVENEVLEFAKSASQSQ